MSEHTIFDKFDDVIYKMFITQLPNNMCIKILECLY